MNGAATHQQPGAGRVVLLRTAVVTTSRVVAAAPEPVAGYCGMLVAAVGWPFRRRARRTLRVNLAHALHAGPDSHLVRRETRRAALLSGRRAADTLWSIARPAQACAATRIEPEGALDLALAQRRGVILAGPHAGWFEVAAAFAGAVTPTPVGVLVDLNAIGRALSPLRSQNGLHVLDAARDAHAALALLGEGGIVVLLSDVYRGGMRGYPVPLLDAVAVLPAGPAVLSRLAGAPIIPFVVRRRGPRQFRFVLSDPVAPPARSSGRDGEIAATRTLADAFSAIIRDAPCEWDAVDAIRWSAV
jgi:lauroyl/myristoyl acyltransferase